MNRSAVKRASKPAYRRFIELPQAKGRTVDKIELTATGDYNSIVIRFRDNVDLEVLINPVLEFKATLYDWKGGSQREIKRWPTVRSNNG